jgi:predicted nucleic acid-binding protein
MRWKTANGCTAMIRVALDTTVLVSLVDARDKWHSSTLTLKDALKNVQAEVFYLDPVINEAVSVLARRLAEQKRMAQFASVLNRLEELAPPEQITWVSPETRRLYPQVMALVRRHGGELNFHDALIALGCQELGIEYIASFDGDFDRIAWLKRLASPGDMPLAT